MPVLKRLQMLLSLFPPKIYTFTVQLKPVNFILASMRKTLPPTIIHPEKTCNLMNPPWSATTKAPAIGLLTNTEIETNVKIVPVLTPIWRTSEICAITAGAILTIVPDANPKRAAKTMRAALLLAGIHIPSTRIVVTIAIAINTLKRPR